VDDKYDVSDVPDEYIRNEADRIAVERGAKWCQANGDHFITTTQENFRLYEGRGWAGKLIEWQPWQEDFWRRLFSWVVWSDFHGRWVRRFTRARLWVPKKNGKSPMAAACGLYLTTADGEQGGKTYSAARDSKQASIVHDHAINMVRMSPELASECVINMTNKRITHTPTNSWYGVISGEHAGQEGLNGNAIIDEGHVVDGRLARVLEYMGASREEPLELMVSTAGDNVDGWGKQQWDLGEMVNRGEVDDLSLLHQCYAAPQDATDEELASNREAWSDYNPSLGFIIDPERFEAELKAARKVPTKWADFKKYRFNMWQSSSSPWIDMNQWHAAKDGHEIIESLAGRVGYLGLDMSLARDMTGAVLIVPVGREDYDGDDDEAPEAKRYYMLPKAWITEAAVDRWKHLVPQYYDWSLSGYLSIQSGNKIDFAGVRADIEEMCKPYRVAEVQFDPMYAAETAPMLAEKLGAECWEFKQTIIEYAEPTQMYERLLGLGLLRHFGHPVMTWMAGHVEVTRADRSGNYRPVKPKVDGREGSRQSHKAIDLIVAGVMAISRASHFREETSIYSTPGNLAL
jgi:phage terminase large subunit-like protein